MSSIKEDQVDLCHAAVCAAETGHVYIVAPPASKTVETSENNHVSEGETCDTFQLVQPPSLDNPWLHSTTACLKGNLYHLGGNRTVDGPSFGYIWCSYDLQEFHTRYTESYKAGHSIWKTRLSSIDEEPKTNNHLNIYDVSTKQWMQFPEDPPFRISGAATVWHLDKLYMIGGYSIEYDCELKSFYQSPVSSVWIFDPSVGKWAMGPPLTKESFTTSNKTIRFKGYCLGKHQTLFIQCTECLKNV